MTAGSGPGYPWPYDNSQISFPFEMNVYPPYLKGIFVDAYIVDGTNLRTGYDPINEQLELITFNMDDPNTVDGIQLRYVNDGSLFFFDNTAPNVEYSVWDFGGWKVIAADSRTERKWFRLTLETANIPGYPFTLNKFIDALDAVFSPRVHEQNLPKLYSVRVTDSYTDIDHILTGEIEIYPGYNVDLATTGEHTYAGKALNNSDQRLLAPVIMSAQPGLGAGRNPVTCEAEASNVYSLNHAVPDVDGNLVISMSGTMRCGLQFSGTGSVVTREPGIIMLDNDGTACCTCEEYGEAYNDILAVQARAIAAGQSLKVVNAEHTDVVDSMQAQRQAREVLDAEITLVSKTGWIVNVMLIFLNNPPGARNAPQLPVVITSAAGSYEIVEGSGYIYSQGTDTAWRAVDIADPDNPVPAAEEIAGNSYMVLSYEIFFTDKVLREDGQAVDVSMSGTWTGAPYSTSVSASKSTELREPIQEGSSSIPAGP